MINNSRHTVETFSALLVLCEGNPTVINGFKGPATRSFDVLFDARLKKIKQTVVGYLRRRDVHVTSL